MAGYFSVYWNLNTNSVSSRTFEYAPVRNLYLEPQPTKKFRRHLNRIGDLNE